MQVQRFGESDEVFIIIIRFIPPFGFVIEKQFYPEGEGGICFLVLFIL